MNYSNLFFRVKMAAYQCIASVTANFFAMLVCAQFDGNIAYFTMTSNSLFFRSIMAANQFTA